MADIEKVIKGLEHCSDRTNRRCNPTCPYHESDFCNSELAQDALELLKQSPVEPFKKDDHHLYCGVCGLRLSTKRRTRYCQGCGRAVDWNG